MRCTILLAAALLVAASFASARPPAVPPALEPWRDFVLHGHDDRRCPLRVGRAAGVMRPCAWPGRLLIEADERGARFSIDWQLHADSDVPLPGDARIRPLDVRVDGRVEPQRMVGEQPRLRLPAGRHRIDGRLEWSRRPERLPVPDAIGLVELRLDGVPVAVPERDARHLWLGRAAGIEAGAESLDVEVFRRLSDGVPQRLTSQLQLEVAGRAREAVLGRVLPDGFVAIGIESDLPALIDGDGQLRVQLRPGDWEIVVEARARSVVDRFEPPANASPWPAQEIWSFDSAPDLRSVQALGEAPVDPGQVGAPWELPTFVLGPGQALQLDEQSRGLDPDRPHRLRLHRSLWLDFDGGGATARDRLSGTLSRPDRLDLAAPWRLERAASDGQDLLVTAGADPGQRGIELRHARLALDATARRDDLAAGAVSGWSHALEAMRLDLHLPPGWRLLHASGADRQPDAWTAQWRLLDLFLFALAVLLARRVLGNAVAALFAGYLLLSFHEPGAPLWTLLAALLLALVASWRSEGRLARGLVWLRNGALLLALLWLLPFAASQLRLALYPQLEQPRLFGAHEQRQREMVAVTYIEPPVAMEMVAPPPPPPAPRSEPFAEQAPQGAARLDRIEVTGSRITAADLSIGDYPTDAVLQSGPGIPDWSWHRSRIEWDGPVAVAESTRLWLSPPWLTRMLRVLALGLIGAVLLQFLRRLRVPQAPTPAATRAATPLLVLAMAWPLATPATAADFPPEPLLDALRDRLLAPPACAPDCATAGAARVELEGDRLRLLIELHALAEVAVPLPDSGRGAALVAVRRGADAASVLRIDSASWLSLPRGVHAVGVEWRLDAVDTLDLRFPLAPARLALRIDGWEASGVHDGRLLGDSLQLTRRAAPVDGDALAASPLQDFPPFVEVERTLMIGTDWTVHTRVIRIAPEQGGFSLRVPLLDGERVLGEDFERHDDGTIELPFRAGDEDVEWTSRLSPSERLVLQAGALDRQAERWNVDIGPLWHAQFDGVPESALDNPGRRRFVPLPGEALQIVLSRPPAVPGGTVAIDHATLSYRPGAQTADSRLSLGLRTTRGGPHVLQLPAGAELLGVELDGRPLSLRLVDGRLALPLLPGQRRVDVRFREAGALGTRLQTPQVELGAPAANLRIEVEWPDARWLLATFGGGIGPAVLLWPLLVLLAAVAVVLARTAPTPLRMHHWLLLGLGLATVSWFALAVVTAWLLLLGLRQRRAEALHARPRWLVMLAQIALVLLTLVAAVALIDAIEQGLLGRPEMQVTGNASSLLHGTLNWFFDRSDGGLPSVSLLSLPLWVYKLAILAWALWLAHALLGWLRWGWMGFAAGGAWPAKRVKAVGVAAGGDADPGSER